MRRAISPLLSAVCAVLLAGCLARPTVERVVDGRLVRGEPTDPTRTAALLQHPPPAPPAVDPGAGLPEPQADQARLALAARTDADGRDKVAAARAASDPAVLPALWGAALALVPTAKGEAFQAVEARLAAGDTLGAARLSGAIADALLAQRNLSVGPLPEPVATLALDDAFTFARERVASRRRKVALAPEAVAVRGYLLGDEAFARALLEERAAAGSTAAAGLLAALRGAGTPETMKEFHAIPGAVAFRAIVARRRRAPEPPRDEAVADAQRLGGLAAAIAVARVRPSAS